MKKSITTTTKFRTGDEVVVIAGRDLGKKGTLQKIFKNNNKAIVNSVNMVKKHTKPNPQAGETGGIVEKEAVIDLSNICMDVISLFRISWDVIELSNIFEELIVLSLI